MGVLETCGSLFGKQSLYKHLHHFHPHTDWWHHDDNEGNDNDEDDDDDNNNDDGDDDYDDVFSKNLFL